MLHLDLYKHCTPLFLTDAPKDSIHPSSYQSYSYKYPIFLIYASMSIFHIFIIIGSIILYYYITSPMKYDFIL